MLTLEQLEDRTLLTAAPLLPTGTVVDQLSAAGEVDVRQLTLTEAGLLTITAQGLSAGLDTRLSLTRADGGLLAQSEGQTPTDRSDRLEQHLTAGTYLVRIESTTPQTGSYQIATTFAAVSPPFQQIPLGTNPVSVVLADFNGDGVLDMATANAGTNDVSILTGVGDGTFYSQQCHVAVGVAPTALAVGDFNRDGKADLVVTSSASANNVRVLVGKGDGTFTTLAAQTVGAGISAVAVADFNHDGKLDLAVCHNTTNSVDVVLGTGSGTFTYAATRAVGATPKSIAVGDFNGDGKLDLVTASNSKAVKDLSVLFGKGDGTFAAAVSVLVDAVPTLIMSANTVVTADFDDDGDLDLACTNQLAFTVVVFLNDGHGNFGAGTSFAAGRRPTTMKVGDFNGDGHADLAIANIFSADISILLGTGDGSFRAQSSFSVGLTLAAQLPQALAIGDLNGDGRQDIVTVNSASGVNPPNSASVLLGRGDGGFRDSRGFAVGDGPGPLAMGDFNGDGRLDLVVPNLGSGDVSVLLGLADGTFQEQQRFGVGITPSSVVVGDFNHDGRLDLAVPNSGTASNFISLLLGIGDGTFQQERRIPSGTLPIGLFGADLNADGSLDLVGINSVSDSISVFISRGDGTFSERAAIPVGVLPNMVTAADINGDGMLDLVAAVIGSRIGSPAIPGTVVVMLGRMDPQSPDGWTLDLLPPFAAGVSTSTVLVRDFDGDGLLDVVAANPGGGNTQPGNPSNEISLLRGGLDAAGRWTLRPEERFSVISTPTGLAAADLNHDGRLDLIVSADGPNEIAILLGAPPPGDAPGRVFAAAQRFVLGSSAPNTLVLEDLNGDGHLDLSYTLQNVAAVAVALGKGDGTFQTPRFFTLSTQPIDMLVADFNGDGIPDIGLSNKFSDDVAVLLGLGDGTFVASSTTPNPIRSVPIVADLNNDGVFDLVVLSNTGQILFRAGRADEPGVYAPPVLVNPGVAAARDLTVLRRGNSVILAALDISDGGTSLYSFVVATGTFLRTDGPTIDGSLPARLVAGDINRDGRDDLVAVAAGSGTLQVFLRTSSGGFAAQPNQVIHVGTNPTMLRLIDVDGNGWLDLVTANQYSADVSVVLNGPNGLAAFDRRYRAGVGLYGLDLFNGSTAVRSLDGTVSLATGDFNGDGVTDVIATDNGSNQLALLLGSGTGGFLNPSSDHMIATASMPTMVVASDFDRDGKLDVAVLCEGVAEIQIFRGDGEGGFAMMDQVAAGNVPTGLALSDVNGDGQLDLLVGNQFGDVLVLSGNNDGTFDPYRRTERTVSLAVADLDGDGLRDFVLANESLDRVVVQYAQPGATPDWQSSQGILGPEAVDAADINGDGITDLIVSNGGGNNLLVYLGLGNGQFGVAHTYFTGTNPARFSLADLDANGWLDVVVANEGSNDVSVLLGQGQRDSNGNVTGWSLTYGPRLNAGYDAVTGKQVGLGPVATAVADVTGDGILDVLVTNHASSNVALLTGIGNGFFNDQQPEMFAVGVDPRQILVGNFDGRPGIDFLTLNAGSNSISYFSGATGSGVQIGTGGLRPLAALAGDFNDDGLTDLMVAHNGNGLFSLLVGTPSGPEIAGGLTFPDIHHPTDLALASRGNGILELFACDEGREVIFFLTFDFRPSPVTSELLPLRDTELAVVAIFVAGSGGSDGLADSAANLSAEAGPLPFQAFVAGLDNHPAAQDGAKGGSDQIAPLFAVPLAVMDQIFRELIQPVGAEFVRAWSGVLQDTVATLADTGSTLGEKFTQAGAQWESMLRSLSIRLPPAVAPTIIPPAEAAEEVEPCAPENVSAVSAAPAVSGAEHMAAPGILVLEIGACMLGVWVLERRLAPPALPGKVRRPLE